MLSSLSVRLARSFALLLPWLMYPFHLWKLQQQKNTPYNLHRTSQWDHEIQYLLLQTADHLASPMGIWNKTNKEAILGKYHKIEKLNLTLTKDLKLSFVPYHYV